MVSEACIWTSNSTVPIASEHKAKWRPTKTMDWPNPKTFWSSVASVMVRSTAFGVSKITTGLRVGACNISFICESIHSQSALWRYCAGGRLQRQKCQEMRPWYHLKSEWVAEWHHRMHCHVYGTASMACAKCDIMCQFRFPLFWGWPPQSWNTLQIFNQILAFMIFERTLRMMRPFSPDLPNLMASFPRQSSP